MLQSSCGTSFRKVAATATATARARGGQQQQSRAAASSFYVAAFGDHQQQQHTHHHHHQQQQRRCFHASTATASSGGGRHGTTIVCVRRDGKVCMMGDGMVSQGNIIVKPNAVKIRRIVPKGTGAGDGDGDGANKKNDNNVTIVGFAGSTADAFTLLERLEGKLDEYPGQLARSCVELAKGWRTDKYLRRLEASLIVADSTVSLELTGNGDVLESHDGILGVGSGSPFALGKYFFRWLRSGFFFLLW